MAGQGGCHSLQGETPSVAHHGDRSKVYRHLQPHRRRRYRIYPRSFRMRQDSAPARHCQAGRGRRDSHGCVRREGQRGGGDLHRVPRTGRPPYRTFPDGKDHHCLQHLQHACGRPRGIRLHSHDHMRILQGHGTESPASGRLHLPLGTGPQGDEQQDGGAARSRCLPRGPLVDYFQLLRPRRSRGAQQRHDRICDVHRHRITCRR